MSSGTGKQLLPCHPARAKELLSKGRAIVHRPTATVITFCTWRSSPPLRRWGLRAGRLR
ncbi:MAG: hypothetical protein ABSA46_19620 [Thermodesulfovibrionales bacterium]